MLDKFVVPKIRPALAFAARALNKRGVSADTVTLTGFLIGLAAIPALATGYTLIALCLLLLNRLADGIDGELARLTSSSDAGSFLDITLDFIFYAAFPVGFALLDPPVNALPATVLIASFKGL